MPPQCPAVAIEVICSTASQSDSQIANQFFLFSDLISILAVIWLPAWTKLLDASTRSFAVTEGMGSADGAFDKDRIPKKAGDPTRREFTYFMLGGARFIYASSARLALIKVMNIAFAALFEMSKRNMIEKEKIDVMVFPDLYAFVFRIIHVIVRSRF